MCGERVPYHTLTPFEQNQIVATLARWVVELYSHRFDAIGGLIQDSAYYRVGSVVAKPFFAVGQHRLPLDRGPFNSAKAYQCACAQWELDFSRTIFAPIVPTGHSRLVIERIPGLLCDLTNRCQGLDEDDSEMAPFSLDIHKHSLKKIYVAAENYMNIVRQYTLVVHILSCSS